MLVLWAQWLQGGHGEMGQQGLWVEEEPRCLRSWEGEGCAEGPLVGGRGVVSVKVGLGR